MSHWLFLPDDAANDLEVLADLSPEQIQKLRKFLDSRDFQLRYSVYVLVAELLGITDEAAAKLCTFINYVQAQRTKNGRPGSAAIEEFEYFLQRVASEKADRNSALQLLARVREKRIFLAELFSELPDYDFSEKVRGLEGGPVPHLHGFHAYCDLRPVYNADASEIMEFFPVITLRIVTHSAASDEAQETLVQLTETDLEKFMEQFERLDKKLKSLKDRYPSLLARKGREDQ